MFPTQRHELRRVFTDVSMTLIVYTALVSLLSTLYSLPYYLGVLDLYYSDWYYYLGTPIIVYPAGFLAMFLGLRHLPTPKLVPQREPEARQILSGLIASLGLLYLASLFTQYLLMGTDTQNLLDDYMTETPTELLILTTVMIAPICEELIFRKLLQDRLLFLGDWTAILISSFFFGLFHTNLYQFFYATAVGMALGYIRIVTGRMKWNILLHMFINLFCGVLTDSFYESEVFSVLVSLLVICSMVYAIYHLIRNRPWQDFYPGPTDIPGREKVIACLTSVTFWVCVVLHLGLSVYAILPY